MTVNTAMGCHNYWRSICWFIGSFVL